jgi:Zn-dependent peptidase ImmA (M78 family)
MPHNPNRAHSQSVLSKMRAVIPNRILSIDESLRIAELQAAHLLALQGIDEGPVPEEIITELPKMRVEFVDVPLSGACYWDGAAWVIEINKTESWNRQRFVIAHEFKHIIDHGYTDRLYPPAECSHHVDHAELVADYFAGCILVPTVLLKRAWRHGIQKRPDLAEYFRVSERTVETRLIQVGLIDRAPRCLNRHHQRSRALRGLATIDNHGEQGATR